MYQFMKKLLAYFLIICFPLLTIVLVNETTKQSPHQISSPFFTKQVAYHSDKYTPNNCNWYCHNKGCQHKRLIQSKFIENMYFTIINGNKASQAYVLSSVIFLALIWPLVIFILIVLNINYRFKSKRK
jgi:hypothetical protein